MDREQEQMQFMGFFGTIKEAFKIIFSWKRIFTQITLTLILPLSGIFLGHILVSQILFFGIVLAGRLHNSHQLSTQWAIFWLFKAAYFFFFLILYLLSTAAVVYTIACIYTSKEITYKKVMSVVPRVWKRLLVTFLWSFLVIFVYNLVAVGVFFFWAVFLAYSTFGIVIGVAILVLYVVGFVYISVIWQLACVVSVLEDKYGRKAVKKSSNLIKGKMAVAVVMFILYFFFFVVIEAVFETFVVLGYSPDLPFLIMIAILCFLFLMPVILFGLVIQTIIYFICKSYHHENIDKPSLSDHLEDYLGDYVRLNRAAKDVQLEQQFQA